ncbi:MAG: protease SohB [Gammaproteobacteria bacterium]|nr:protease SohB [Gammaproteobacteria bacterium]
MSASIITGISRGEFTLTEFLLEYGLFLSKFLTVAVVIAAAVIIIMLFVSHSKMAHEDHIEVRNLNQKYEQLELLLKSSILPKKLLKKDLKQFRKDHKEKEKHPDTERNRLFVLRFDGDIRATGASSLAEEVTAVLMIARNNDEALVVLESAGGTVHGYGYAASQLARIRDKGIKLTVAVDKVAASGGYMMACVADRIIAAPFAIIGSIGVLAQIPNFNRLLKKHDIDFEQISAGKYKRTLSLFGENTDEGREKFCEELEEAHELFKKFVKENREQVDIDAIATGEHWYGQKALDLKLVDEISTSDSFLTEASKSRDLYEIRHQRRKSMTEKLMSSFTSAYEYIRG